MISVRRVLPNRNSLGVRMRQTLILVVAVYIGCADNSSNVRGSGEGGSDNTETPPPPQIRHGKHSKKFSKDNDLCVLEVFSNRPFGAEPVMENHVDACLQHQDTTAVDTAKATGYAFLKFGGGATRGDHMDVSLKCTNDRGILIGELKVNKFDNVPKDTPLSTIGWFFEGIGKALKMSDSSTDNEEEEPDTSPGFSIIVDASSVPEAERNDIPPLHKNAAIKYCKQMAEIRDRVFPKKQEPKIIAPEE